MFGSNLLGWRLAGALAVMGLGTFSLPAQSPDASLRGLVMDTEGKPVANSTVTATQPETGFSRKARTDSDGRFNLELLPRGFYEIRVEAAGFRGVELRGIVLEVGARREENLVLSPAAGAAAAGSEMRAVMESLPPPSGLAVDTIASSVSVVVDESKILQLPLSSRNIYSLFLLQPGVTSEGGIVRRGLSFSVHGQRVSGSNYRLDGVDNNDIILTGPISATSVESVQEFRMVNSSFSAENGRATAFVAQVVTRSGSNQFRGSAFEYLGNDKLNANTFQNNAENRGRPALRRNQFGFSLTGPLRRNRTFISGALESSRLRSGTPMAVALPSPGFIAGLPRDSAARRLVAKTPPANVAPSKDDPNVGTLIQDVRDRIDAIFATVRLDHQAAEGRDRFVLRYTPSLSEEQRAREFFGYPDLWPADEYSSHNALLAWSRALRSGPTNDLRIGWSRARSRLRRPYSEVPVLQGLSSAVELPGNRRQSAERDNSNVLQVSDTFAMRRGRSALVAGFEFRRNYSDGLSMGLQSQALGAGGLFPDGFYAFEDLAAFGRDEPFAFAMGVDRFSSGSLRRADLGRRYRSNDFAFFLQDELKLTRRFSLTAGLRYEYFGVPHNAGPAPDYNYYFGSGSTIEERVANGTLRSTRDNPGQLEGLLYNRDWLNLAPSLGFAWDLLGKGRTVLRAGYSLALDRVFDTLRDLRTNVLQVAYCIPFPPNPCAPRLLIPGEDMLPRLNQDLSMQPPGDVVQLDENLRTPYAQNWFVGVQHSVTSDTLLEIGHAASVGRRLISRDLTNRATGTAPHNPLIGFDTFLTNAGNSNYLGMETSLRRRFARGLQFQVSYTYSHAIDNLSDPFEGVRTGPRPGAFALAGFTRQFDARVDRGNANFDQRHNLIMNAIWNLPSPKLRTKWPGWILGGWTTSVIGGHRSGFPVTVISASGLDGSLLNNNRPDLVAGGGKTSRNPVSGGVQWLNPADYVPVDGRVGNLGRGSLPGPGFWGYDFALQKSFGPAGENIRVQLRAEFYNVFNHANLSRPVSKMLIDPFTMQVDPDFGKAFYGHNRTYSRFGDLPLENPSRAIQLAIRIEF